MRVFMGVPDEAGCGHYRVLYPAAVVRELGHEVETAAEINVQMEWRNDGKIHPVEAKVGDAEVVVLQRPLRGQNLEMIRVLQDRGVAVVCDVDDDFSCVDPRHIAWHGVQPKLSPDNNREHLAKACALADLVTVTTPALAQRYGAHGRVAVLPNCVPRSMLGVTPAKPRDGQTIGWAGHVATHPRDLQATRGGVAQAMRATGARFLNVGNGNGVGTALELGLDQDLEATGSQEFADYPYAVARFDVGIAPLADTKFNEAKSALKGLEMAAVGVPFVASPTADYRRMASEGIGVLAKWRARNWASQIKRLLGDDGFSLEAHDLVESGTTAVRERHTYEDNAWRWLEAWDWAIVHARRSRPPRRRPAAQPAAS